MKIELTESGRPLTPQELEHAKQYKIRERKVAAARKAQTRKEQARGRKALTGALTRAKISTEQKKGVRDAKERSKRLKRLEKEDTKRATQRLEGLKKQFPNALRDIDTQRYKMLPLPPVDPTVSLPKAVQEIVNVVNAYYEPHVSFSFNAEVLNLSRCDPRVARIADGIAVAIKMVLAQHELRSRPINVHANTVAVPTKQKEK